jgi:hypothetical protein
MVNPSTFIRGQHVEAIFMENDKPKWYKGYVKNVNHFGEDNHGTYVQCEVEYEDGDVFEDVCFYDCDYENEESLDSWRYTTSLNDIIAALNEVKDDIHDLKDDIHDLKDDIENLRSQKTKTSCSYSYSYVFRIAFIMATMTLMKTAYLYLKDDYERCRVIFAFETAMRNLTQLQ